MIRDYFYYSYSLMRNRSDGKLNIYKKSKLKKKQ